MRLLLASIFLLSTSLSFASSYYEGQGNETDMGVEVCGMQVEKVNSHKLKIQIRALGIMTKHITLDKNIKNFNIITKTAELPASDVSIEGVMNNGIPVSFKATIKENDFEDTMTCTF